MQTKAFVRFFNRLAHYGADLELADILSIANNAGRLCSDGAQYLFDFVNPERHKRLSNRIGNPHNRMIAITHLKATLYSSFIKDLYEDTMDYFQTVLFAAAESGLDAGRLIGEHKTDFTANDILSAGGWEQTVRLVSRSVFRSMENERDTLKLLTKMNRKLDLAIDETIFDAAIPYLEIRHLVVHSDGNADEAFCRRFPDFGASVGKEIDLGFDVIQRAEAALSALVKEFDCKIVEKKLLNAKYLQK